MANPLTAQDRVMLLLTLIPYLLEHDSHTVTELAETFDVEPRVIRRLVQFLGVAGIPGETRTYQHEDLFDIDWDALEQHDIVRLTNVVAVDDTPRFSSAETSALIAGLHALTTLLPATQREVAESTARKLSAVRAHDSGQTAVSVTAEANDDTLLTVSTALQDAAVLTFSYQDANGAESQRTVRPLVLGQSGGGWYLRAYCYDREAERTFAIDRMRQARIRSQPLPADLMPHSLVLEVAQPSVSENAELFSPTAGEPAVTATVKLSPAAVHRLAHFMPRVVGDAGQGWVRAEIDLWHAEAAVRVVQAAPGEVVVEAPGVARAAVLSWAVHALAGDDGGHNSRSTTALD